MSKFVMKNNGGSYSFHFEGDDAVIIGGSEGYANPAAVRKGIASIMKIAKDCNFEDRTEEGFRVRKNPKFEIFRDGNKKLRFYLRARNGQVVMTSVPFKDMDELLIAVMKVKQAGTAKLEMPEK